MPRPAAITNNADSAQGRHEERGWKMKCPGQDTQYWTAEAIYEVDCPQCSRRVEFFKDDTTRKCNHCGRRFVNPRMDFGCAAYCQYAEQCLGDLPPELVAQQADLLKDRVAVARYLQKDFKRIGHITRRVRHAEILGKKKQVNLPVLLIAAYLWQLGETEEACLKIAQTILEDLKAPAALADQIGRMVQCQGGACDLETFNTAEYQLLIEAERLALDESWARNQ